MTKNKYMIMKTRYFKLVTVCLLAVSLFASCLGDLDTLPLDDNELTGEMVYSTPEGYIGMIARLCCPDTDRAEGW